MKKVNIAVIGATTSVGEVLVELLAERNFPVKDFYPVAGESEAGGRVEFNNKQCRVEDIATFDFAKVDIAFFVDMQSISEKFVEQAARHCVVIDRSPQFRCDEDIPLVIPEINADAISQYKNRNIISSPGCISIQLAMILKPISELAGLNQITVSTYQAVSGDGREGLEELGRQTAALLNFQEVKKSVYNKQMAFNVIPHIGALVDGGHTLEEMKIIQETRRLISATLSVNVTTVRVPVFYGHAISLYLEASEDLSVESVIEQIQNIAGVEITDLENKENYPTPVTDAAASDTVFVGRIRQSMTNPRGINLWLVTDNLRKGAALNGVQIAEILVKHYL